MIIFFLLIETYYYNHYYNYIAINFVFLPNTCIQNVFMYLKNEVLKSNLCSKPMKRTLLYIFVCLYSIVLHYSHRRLNDCELKLTYFIHY